jgi:C-terminal processing protease CtpA/Prc
MDGIERERLKSMLANVKSAVKKDYYDPNFHGIDIEARFKQASDKLKEVTTTGQGFAVIAQVLTDFKDSHLYFLPPATNLDVEYGWRQVMYGDKSFVTLVKPKSDAEAKGLKVGDQLIAIEGFRPTRKEMWKVFYYYNIIAKKQTMKLTVLSPGDEQPRQIEFNSKIRQLPKVVDRNTFYGSLVDTSGRTEVDFNYFIKSGSVAVWKMPTFAIDPDSIEVLMKKVKDSPNLILDLRSNGGGYVDTLEKLAGFIFDKDLTIATLKGRKEMDPQKSKTRGAGAYKGNLIVLIDSDSGSAAEIFARLVQLEKRGKVIGDVSAGAVMQSRQQPMTTGANDEVYYGASITMADVIMSDGNSLENVGVTPDILVLPTGEDLAKQRDPILAKAFESFGSTMTSEQAGQFFRYRWTETAKGENRIEIDTP